MRKPYNKYQTIVVEQGDHALTLTDHELGFILSALSLMRDMKMSDSENDSEMAECEFLLSNLIMNTLGTLRANLAALSFVSKLAKMQTPYDGVDPTDSIAMDRAEDAIDGEMERDDAATLWELIQEARHILAEHN